VKIGSIVIRCYGFDEMMAFWQKALHYAPREPAEDGWVVLRDLEGRGPKRVPGAGRRAPRAHRND
jgi:hypothetical protein